MRRFHHAAVVALALGLFASVCVVVVGGCNSDPHETHVQSNVGIAH
jgi:hypothetical protein